MKKKIYHIITLYIVLIKVCSTKLLQNGGLGACPQEVKNGCRFQKIEILYEKKVE